MPRVTAVVQCRICKWSAKHSADEPKETIEFLDKRRIEHYEERHHGAIPNVSETITMATKRDEEEAAS